MRARLMAGSPAWCSCVHAVTFVVVYHSTGIRLRGRDRPRLHGDAVQLTHALAVPATIRARALLARARGYAAAQPYSRPRRCCSCSFPGVGTRQQPSRAVRRATPDDGETAAEQAHENALGRQLLDAPAGLLDHGTRPTSARCGCTRLPVKAGGVTVYAGAGEPLATVSRSQEVVAHSFALAGAIALVARAARLLSGRARG